MKGFSKFNRWFSSSILIFQGDSHPGSFLPGPFLRIGLPSRSSLLAWRASMKICNAVMRPRQCRVFLAMLRWMKGGRVGADWSWTLFLGWKMVPWWLKCWLFGWLFLANKTNRKGSFRRLKGWMPRKLVRWGDVCIAHGVMMLWSVKRNPPQDVPWS